MSVLLAMFRRKWILATLVVFAASAVCIRLGIWQLDRLEQRRTFNAHYLATTNMAPLILDSAAQAPDLPAMEYRAVTVTGTFDFEHQVALRNRYHADQYGYHLLTPLILSDGSAVIVERGWIPAEGNANPSDWRKYDQPGEQTISGIIRLGQSKPDVGGVPDPNGDHLDFWNIVNLERISLQIPNRLLPIFVQPNPDETPVVEPVETRAPPYPYQPTIEITEGPHFGYALQWFTFAVVFFVGYLIYLRKSEN